MIEITRTYNNATVKKNYEGLTDVVTSVYVIVTASDMDFGARFTAGTDIFLDPPEPLNFVPYEELSKETIESWVIDKEQYKNFEDLVVSKLEQILDPPEVVKPLSFDN